MFEKRMKAKFAGVGLVLLASAYWLGPKETFEAFAWSVVSLLGALYGADAVNTVFFKPNGSSGTHFEIPKEGANDATEFD